MTGEPGPPASLQAALGSWYPTDLWGHAQRTRHESARSDPHVRDCEPLVPTEASRVYANRFRSEAKEIYTVYNGTGHMFYGDVLAKSLPPDHHIVDLLRCEEVRADAKGGPTRVRLFLSREDVTCLAVLPRRISIARDGNRLNVEVNGDLEDGRVNLCDSESNVLASAAVEDRRAALAIDESTAKPACVKLCRNDLLLDVAPLSQDY